MTRYWTILVSLVWLLLPAVGMAKEKNIPVPSYPPLFITEEDGTPTPTVCGELRFPVGTLSVAGPVCSVTTGVAGGDSILVDGVDVTTSANFVNTGDVTFTRGGAGAPHTITGTVKADVITPAMLADGDFGAFAIAGNVATVQGLQFGTAFPGSPSTGDVFRVTDDSVAGACDSAGGTAVTLCAWNGSTWGQIGTDFIQNRKANCSGDIAAGLLCVDTDTYQPFVGNGVAAVPIIPTPGLNTQCIFNDGGAFGADDGCNYDKANNTMALGKLLLTCDPLTQACGLDFANETADPVAPVDPNRCTVVPVNGTLKMICTSGNLQTVGALHTLANNLEAGVRQRLNLIAGANIELTATDNSVDDRVDVQLDVVGLGDPPEAMTLDSVLANNVQRGCTTCADESTAMSIGDGISPPLKFWANGFGGFAMFPGNLTWQLQAAGWMRWMERGGADILYLDNDTRSIRMDAQTASRCARFDANKNLVSATGDCASGDTISLNFACTDNNAVDADHWITADEQHAATCRSSSDERVFMNLATTRTGVAMACEIQTAPGAGTSNLYRLRDDGADSDLLCTIADTATSCTATGGTNVFTAGTDTASIRVTFTGNPADSGWVRCAVEFRS